MKVTEIRDLTVDELRQREKEMDDQLFRLRIGERTQQDRVDEREHRGAGADPYRERRHGDDRESRPARKRAAGMPDIAHEFLDRSNSAGVLHFLVDALEVLRRADAEVAVDRRLAVGSWQRHVGRPAARRDSASSTPV